MYIEGARGIKPRRWRERERREEIEKSEIPWHLEPFRFSLTKTQTVWRGRGRVLPGKKG